MYFDDDRNDLESWILHVKDYSFRQMYPHLISARDIVPIDPQSVYRQIIMKVFEE